MMPTSDALEIAVSALESRGLHIEGPTEDEPNLRGFYFPNPFNGEAHHALVRHLPALGIIEVNVLLNNEGHEVHEALRDGLLQLMNTLHYNLPGVVFTYNAMEGGDEIELSCPVPYADPEDVAALLEKAMVYLEQVHRQTLPLFYTYLTQEVRVRMDTEGFFRGYRPTISVEETMRMLETGAYGIA